jgi:predicted amidohydrolase
MVVAPDGEVVVEAGQGEAVLHAVLERDRLERVRATNPSLANRRM